jgi:hypothetical protein
MKALVLALTLAALPTAVLASGGHHMRPFAAGHDAPMSRAAADTSLLGATAIVAANVNVPVVRAELQSPVESAPRYDIDVRLPGNAIGRLVVVPASGEIAWRSPAVQPAQ